MAKAELKTKLNEASVEDFIDTIESETMRDDCRQIIKLMQKATDAAPKMWGGNIVGFGLRELKYESGRELDWFIVGFSPRKQNLTLYALCSWLEFPDLLSKLGKHKLGKSCLYVKNLNDIDFEVLEKLINQASK